MREVKVVIQTKLFRDLWVVIVVSKVTSPMNERLILLVAVPLIDGFLSPPAKGEAKAWSSGTPIKIPSMAFHCVRNGIIFHKCAVDCVAFTTCGAIA